jgi:hypothetical protein
MLSVFMTYTKLLGNELSATVAFTALTLFNMLRHALDEGPSTIISIIQGNYLGFIYLLIHAVI